MTYYAIVVGCNKTEPEFIFAGNSLDQLKNAISRKISLPQDLDTYLRLYPSHEIRQGDDGYNDEMISLETNFDHWGYELPKEAFKLLTSEYSNCSCTCNIYIIKTPSDFVDLKHLRCLVWETQA